MGERKLTKAELDALDAIHARPRGHRRVSAYLVHELLDGDLIEPTYLPCGCVFEYELTTEGRSALEASK